MTVAAAAVSPKPKEHKPVTVVVSRKVKPGCEQAYEEWMHGVIQVSSQYEGHLGANVFRPTDDEHPDYVLIFSFDSQENLDKWNRSDDRREWLAKMAPLVATSTKPQILTGLENWFTLPAHAHAPVPPPPRFKMAIVTWIAIYPLINILSSLLGPYLAPLPRLLQTAVMSVLMISLMTYVVMPRLTRLFASWLFPKSGK